MESRVKNQWLLTTQHNTYLLLQHPPSLPLCIYTRAALPSPSEEMFCSFVSYVVEEHWKKRVRPGGTAEYYPASRATLFWSLHECAVTMKVEENSIFKSVSVGVRSTAEIRTNPKYPFSFVDFLKQTFPNTKCQKSALKLVASLVCDA